MNRDDAKSAFLTAAGWGSADISPLAGDASNRRYERLANGPGGQHAVLMDAPAERSEDISIFLAFTGLLRQMGLSAPDVLEVDIASGFAIIEDLGDALYARVAAETLAKEMTLYEASVDLLAAMHETPPPTVAEGSGATVAIQPYDGAVLRREARLAPDWWRMGVMGEAPSDDFLAEHDALIDAACADVEGDRSALVMRDYHAENLLWLPDRSGHCRVGLLDYQDALLGAPAYDLVSLLEDARRDTSEDLQAAMLDRYIRTTGFSNDAFRAAYAALGAQRNLKIVGIFARLHLRDGKPAYLDLITRVWNHLQRDLAHPALRPLAEFVSQHIPAPTPDALTRIRATKV